MVLERLTCDIVLDTNVILLCIIFLLILLLFFIDKTRFIKYSNTVLGKFFVLCFIISFSYVHIGIGITIVSIVIIYYKYYGYINTIDEIDYLDGIDCIYWINLDRSIDRRKHMEEMFMDPVFSGKPIKRISAEDGTSIVLRDKIMMKNKKNTNLEYACLVSHLNTIKIFSETEYDIALIFEDDVTLEFKQFWKKSLKTIIDDAPSDWEIIQLCYITKQVLTYDYTLNNYKKNKYGDIASMAAYIIKNSSAKKFIHDTYDPETEGYKLLDYHTHEADHYIYKCLRTYTYKYPYFIYPTDNDSTLHPEDLNSHIKSKLKLIHMYESIG